MATQKEHVYGEDHSKRSKVKRMRKHENTRHTRQNTTTETLFLASPFLRIKKGGTRGTVSVLYQSGEYGEY